MSQIRFRQIARLVNLAQADLKATWETPEMQFRRDRAFDQLAILSLLVLYGNPKIDEPLLKAWQRCAESEPWQPVRKHYGYFWEHQPQPDPCPFKFEDAMQLGRYFRHHFLHKLPGEDEKAKLAAVLEKTPLWLLWFTYADVSARIFGIRLPDLASIRLFMRGELIWPELPTGPFECQPWPEGRRDIFVPKTFEEIAKDMTPRERKRTLRIYATYAAR